mmetsp:Transcript_28913/g.27688  ORF Transcript_28913/g.27688 Transcript_28913/m.27688 type:complete len:432 (+) Transcript_28913:217-1512(+)
MIVKTTFLILSLLINPVLCLKTPLSLPVSITRKGGPIIESKLLPILNSAMTENRSNLLGKGNGYSMLENLREELTAGLILTDDSDFQDVWQPIIAQSPSVRWDELPDNLAESLFYWKFYKAMLENKVDDNPVFDLFTDKKVADLKLCQTFMEEIAVRLPDIVMADNPLEALEMFLSVSLWSMKKDLRLIGDVRATTGKERRKAFQEGLGQLSSYFLINDISHIKNIFKEGKSARGNVDVILGKTGRELIGDLSLAYTLIALNLCETVTFHTKKYPTLEYGATTLDVLGHIEHLADPVHSDIWAVRHFGEALRANLYQGRLVIAEDVFWCLPTPLWELPARLEEKLCSSRLVLIKGDDNYRRLLGDRDWPLDTGSNAVLDYWPVPVCALRIIETEIGCGIEQESSSKVGFNRGSMKNGRWGMVQYTPGVEPR